MYKNLLFVLLVLFFYLGNLVAEQTFQDILIIRNLGDTSRLAELDHYWNAVSRTVKEGDFEGYSSLYHEDAVVIFATGKKKTSLSIASALANWKDGFLEAKAGRAKSNVEFRFSQRINDENTAHETGIFHYTSQDDKGMVDASSYIHFEMLLIKKNDQWLALMEYQKSLATEEEWKSLK